MGESFKDWEILLQTVKKAHEVLYRHGMRMDLQDSRSHSDGDVDPDFSLFVDILQFYQGYRKLEMEMARFYPDVSRDRQNLAPELDGMSRDAMDGK